MTEDKKTTTTLHRKDVPHRRKSADSADLQIEELFPDDMGYDADVEIVRPDRYEDFDSEAESEPAPSVKFRSVDEELAERMRQLGREQVVHSPAAFMDRGRKRTSLELDHDGSMLDAPMSPDLEVLEVAENIGQPSPAKRRKRRARRTETTNHALSTHVEAWTDSSEKADAQTLDSRDGSVLLSPRSDVPEKCDMEAMDIT